MSTPKLNVVSVPFFDTGLGREAGYANDAELIAAAKARRAEAETMLTPEALALLDRAERDLPDAILGGA